MKSQKWMIYLFLQVVEGKYAKIHLKIMNSFQRLALHKQITHQSLHADEVVHGLNMDGALPLLTRTTTDIRSYTKYGMGNAID
ncbi:unnamed protein product [Penicillium olsonii]|nr:unnamed protein product [Penicillium olsonii]